MNHTPLNFPPSREYRRDAERAPAWAFALLLILGAAFWGAVGWALRVWWLRPDSVGPMTR